MYRKVASTELTHTAVGEGRSDRRPARRRDERWPRGVTLPLALMVSLALWAALINGAMALFAR